MSELKKITLRDWQSRSQIKEDLQSNQVMNKAFLYKFDKQSI